MSPIQALELLNNATAQAPLTRIDHFRVQQAIEVLKKAIEPKPEVKKEEVKK